MELTNEGILQFLNTYQLLAVFAGAFFLGESVILIAFFLTSQGLLVPAEVFAISLIGTVSSDSLWYVLGKQHDRLEKKSRTYANRFERIRTLVTSFSHSPARVLLFIKFFYGTRVLIILYLAATGTPFRTFLLYNSIGTIIWLLVLILLGSLLGIGYATIPAIYQSVEYGALFVLIGIIITKVLLWKKRSHKHA